MTLEQECLNVLATDLGPAAKAFLYRVCRQHLHKEPAMLQKTDIDKLSQSCYLVVQQALGVPTAEKVMRNLTKLK